MRLAPKRLPHRHAEDVSAYVLNRHAMSVDRLLLDLRIDPHKLLDQVELELVVLVPQRKLLEQHPHNHAEATDQRHRLHRNHVGLLIIEMYLRERGAQV